MAKGDDAIAKNRNKAIRKRNRRAGADSMEAIQGVQACKRRRKAGMRRCCESMCYALPTPEDPFLDRRDRKLKLEKKKEAARKAASLEPGTVYEEKLNYKGRQYQGGEDAGDSDDDINAGYDKELKRKRVKDASADADEPVHVQKRRKVDTNDAVKQKASENGRVVRDHSLKVGSPSAQPIAKAEGGTGVVNERPRGIVGVKVEVKDEVMLAAISEAGLMAERLFSNQKEVSGASQSADLFRKQVWKAYSEGVDILGSCSLSCEEKAYSYVSPSVAHVKKQRANGDVLSQPFVVIVVLTQELALRALRMGVILPLTLQLVWIEIFEVCVTQLIKYLKPPLQVRRVFRVLKKALGISSVCLHCGTSIERQTEGLKIQTPDIVVATPDRLSELLSRQAISLSSVSLFVLDDLDDITGNGMQSDVSKIKEYMNRRTRKLILSKSYPERALIMARQLVTDPIARVASENSIQSTSACITQTVSVFTDISKRMNKMQRILQQFWEKLTRKNICTVLVLVENEETLKAVLPEVLKIGFSTAIIQGAQKQEIDGVIKQIREGSVQAVVTTIENVGHVPLDRMKLIINYSFPETTQVYEQILSGMARQTVDGVLHSFCSAAMAPSASQLVQLLQSCSQEVPRALQMLAEAASLVQLGLVSRAPFTGNLGSLVTGGEKNKRTSLC